MTANAGPAVNPPAGLGIRADAGIPPGIAIDLDPDTRQIAADVLFGGSPARILRLSGTGAAALAELSAGVVASAAAAATARLLTDTGMAHPHRPAGLVAPDVTVVIPVRDRAAELASCLTAVGTGYPVVVVDDGSAEPAAVAAACAAHRARLLRRSASAGPGPARNTALRAIGTEFVAFLDSDCAPPPDWITDLAGHFADPLVAAVAPRIVAGPAGQRGTPPGGSPLDLGERPARVAPLTRVAYVPTAALLVRRAALGDGFDEQLRYGEDVDLVWRLIEAGWRVRYDPAVRVTHSEPGSRLALLRRRFSYGTSAAALTRRHPGSVAPLVLQPWPAITTTALLARRPLAAAAAFSAGTALLARRLRAAGLPASGLAGPMAGGVFQTWLGTGRWCGQFAGPALLLALARPGGKTPRARWGRRLAAASLLAGPPLTDWARHRAGGHGAGGHGAGGHRAGGHGAGGHGAGGHGAGGHGAGDALRFVAAALADQAAYGAGVCAGCWRERLISPVLPSVRLRPVEGLSRTPARPRRAAGTGPRSACQPRTKGRCSGRG